MDTYGFLYGKSFPTYGVDNVTDFKSGKPGTINPFEN